MTRASQPRSSSTTDILRSAATCPRWSWETPSPAGKRGPGSRLLVPVERNPPDHRRAPEPLAQPIERVLRRGGARGPRIEQIDRVGLFRGAELGDADADQAKSGSIGFAKQEIATGTKDSRGKLRGIAQGARAGPQPEILGLELQRDRRARKIGGLEPSRNFLAQDPQAPLHGAEAGDVAVECGFGRHALGLALRRYRPRIDAAGEPRQPQPLAAVAAHQVAFLAAGEVRDAVEPVARQPP